VIVAVSYTNNRAGKKRLQAKAHEYLTLLARTLETAIWDMDEQAIRNIGMSYAQNDVIAALTITDDAGEVLYHTAKEYEGDTITRSGNITHQEEVIGSVAIVATAQWYTEASRYALWTSIVTAGAVLFTLVFMTGFFLRTFLQRPLALLIRGSENLAGGDYDYRFDDLKYREMNILALKFHQMATQIEERETQLIETHRELVDTARRVGMAEVATGVLHNVGNVINSVGVTTASMHGILKNSRTPYLSDVVKVLEEHTDDLGAFLTSDARGLRLPTFLAELSNTLTNDQEHLRQAVEKLMHFVQHLTEIIALQQGYGKPSGLSEPVLLSNLIEDAVRINSEAISRHDIEVRREYATLPSMLLDRPKVLQIVTNLISNAKYALSQNEKETKRLTLRLTEPEAGRVRIEVSDNGVGIIQENVTRIFGYGFTTHQDGHGFGLHSGALAAKEMGGSLRAESDGPGTGATFTLTLPFTPEGRQDA
jgi:signal transduction histidine kinase